MASPTNAARQSIDAGDDEQVVWVYCQGDQEKKDVAACCQASQRPRRRPQKLALDGWKRWQPMLQSGIPKVPAPYTMAGREAFWVDAGTYLVASLESRGGGRWPPLLVTDNENLCQVAVMGDIRSRLAEVAQIKESELLTVVYAADFGHLCGVLVAGSPLPRCEPLMLSPEDWKEPEETLSREVKLPCGVFMQHLNLVSIGKEQELGERECLYGSRCVALFSDGRSAYCAVSPDGSRSVEAAGNWKVVNGQVVIRAEGPRELGAHLQLSKLKAMLLPNLTYEQPIFVSVDELESDFQAISLAECIPRGGHLLRLQLLEEGVPTTSMPSEAAVLTSALDSTFNTAWGVTSPTVDVERQEPGPSRPSEPSTYFLRTPIHALLSLANPGDRPAERPAAPAAPRLFGVQRGITTSLSADVAWSGEVPDAGTRRLPARALPPDDSREVTFATCKVQPGCYMYEFGQPADYSYKRLDLKLHVEGGCDYKEVVQGSSLRSVPQMATWRLEAKVLVLDSAGSGFILRESRGSKSLERKVGRIEMPYAALKRCRYTPFEQQVRPFPFYKPQPESSLIFGVVDPESPALRGLRCRPDRLPYHAFERELRGQGLPVDEILTDFRFVDRDADGLISVDEMRRLESYGNPVAAPEVLEELREALVQNFGTLAAAFEALSATAGAGRVTQEEFERFLKTLDEAARAGTRPVAPGGRGQPLKDWLANADEDTRVAVYATLCPGGPSDAIDLADFLSLNLHSAVLALRRLEHFQVFIFEGFGRSADVFRKVFKALGPAEGRGLSRKALWEGAHALGYPCEMRVMRSVFSLLDRNFDGEVSAREFQKLLDFSSEQVLHDLEALKRFADMLGGLEAAFAKFLDRERILQGLPAAPKMTSYDAFHKVCVQAGFNKMAPKADLRMLFLFLHEVSGRQATGLLSFNEWSLLKGFNSKAISGSPARLRRILQDAFGNVDAAFERMHTSWLRRALAKGLKQTAMAGLVHNVLNPTAPERSPSAVKKPLLSGLRGSSPGFAKRPGEKSGSLLKRLPARPGADSPRGLPPVRTRPTSALGASRPPIGLMPAPPKPQISAVDWDAV